MRSTVCLIILSLCLAARECAADSKNGEREQHIENLQSTGSTLTTTTVPGVALLDADVPLHDARDATKGHLSPPEPKPVSPILPTVSNPSTAGTERAPDGDLALGAGISLSGPPSRASPSAPKAPGGNGGGVHKDPGSDSPGTVGTNGQAAPSKSGVVDPKTPAAGTNHRPDGSRASPGDGRTGNPLSSPPSPNRSNSSGGSGSEKTGGLPSGTVHGSTVDGIGITSTGSKINSTTTTKMVDDVKPKQNTIETSTAPITTLIKPTKTVQPQPVEKKNDGSNRKALLSAFPAILTLTVMAVLPMY